MKDLEEKVVGEGLAGMRMEYMFRNENICGCKAKKGKRATNNVTSEGGTWINIIEPVL